MHLVTIYVPSQQLQGQSHTQHSADIGSYMYIMDTLYIKSRVNCRNTIMQENKQTKEDDRNDNYKQNIRIAKQQYYNYNSNNSFKLVMIII
jgi:hypothetical protein